MFAIDEAKGYVLLLACTVFRHRADRWLHYGNGHFYRPHQKDDGRLYFQSVHTCGGTPSQVWVGGVPHPRSR